MRGNEILISDSPIIEVINCLYKAFDVFNHEFFDDEIEYPIITLQKQRSNNLGHYVLTPTWFEGEESYHEININPLHLNDRAYEILGVLLHEMCHAMNNQNGIKDCSGKKHNKKFIAQASRVGLRDGENNGDWGYTLPTDELKEKFNELFDKEFLDTVESCLYMDDAVEVKTPKKRKKTIFEYVCPHCGLTVKAKAEKNIVCGECEIQLEMQIEEDENEETEIGEFGK